MSKALERIVSDESRQRLLLAVAFPLDRTASIREIAAEAGLTLPDTIQLINEPRFMAEVRQITFAQASTALHGIGIADLVSIAMKGKDRERLTAWKLIAQITGDLKQKHQHDLRVTFEDLRERKSAGDLAGIFDIRSNIIDGEIEE